MRLASAVEHALMLDDVAIMDDEFFVFVFVFHNTYRSKRKEMLDGLWRKKSLEPDDAGTNWTASKLDKSATTTKEGRLRVIVVDVPMALIRISEEERLIDSKCFVTSRSGAVAPATKFL
jgi:hypothetical protein